VGRKATDPIGIAGLPKLQVSCRDRITRALSSGNPVFVSCKAYPGRNRENMENSRVFFNPLSSGLQAGEITSPLGMVEDNREEKEW